MSFSNNLAMRETRLMDLKLETTDFGQDLWMGQTGARFHSKGTKEVLILMSKSNFLWNTEKICGILKKEISFFRIPQIFYFFITQPYLTLDPKYSQTSSYITFQSHKCCNAISFIVLSLLSPSVSFSNCKLSEFLFLVRLTNSCTSIDYQKFSCQTIHF